MNVPETQNNKPEADTPEKPHEETDAELIKRFRQKVNDDEHYLLMILTAGTGHTLSIHVGTDYPDVMERVLTQVSPRAPKFSNSTFQTDDDCLMYVKLALNRHAPKIIKWLKHEPEKPTTTVLYNTKNTITGYGFEFESAECGKKYPTETDRGKPSIYDYKSHACHVDLIRPGSKEKLSDDILNNIRISTAYPQMGPQYGTNLHSDLRPIIVKTQTYRNSTPIKQVWFDYISNNPDHAIYTTIPDETRLQIYVPDPPRENTILIGTTPEECVIRLMDPDPANPTPLTAAILQTGKFPDGTIEFPFTETVRNILANIYKDELDLADYLYSEIQKKLGGGHDETSKKPSIPEPKTDPSLENLPPTKIPPDPVTVPPEQHTSDTDTPTTISQIPDNAQSAKETKPSETPEERKARLLNRKLPNISGIKQNDHDETQLGD